MSEWDGIDSNGILWDGMGWDDKGPRQGVAAPTARRKAGGAAHKLNRMPKGATSRGTNTHTHTHTRTLRVIVIEKADTGTRPIRQKYAHLYICCMYVCLCVCAAHIYVRVYGIKGGRGPFDSPCHTAEMEIVINAIIIIKKTKLGKQQ